MSYSCTEAAGNVEQKISELCYNMTGMSNMYVNGNKEYFYEVGRETSDGSIVGKVNLIENTNGQKLAYPKGSFKINKNGKIVRFPFLPKSIKEQVK